MSSQADQDQDAKHQQEPEDAVILTPKPALLGAEESSILTEDLAGKLTPYLPFTYRRQTWEKIFCTGIDGYNLNAIYTRVIERKLNYRTTPGCLILIKTLEGDVLGGFSSIPLEVRTFPWDTRLSGCINKYADCIVARCVSWEWRVLCLHCCFRAQVLSR